MPVENWIKEYNTKCVSPRQALAYQRVLKDYSGVVVYISKEDPTAIKIKELKPGAIESDFFGIMNSASEVRMLRPDPYPPITAQSSETAVVAPPEDELHISSLIPRIVFLLKFRVSSIRHN